VALVCGEVVARLSSESVALQADMEVLFSYVSRYCSTLWTELCIARRLCVTQVIEQPQDTKMATPGSLHVSHSAMYFPPPPDTRTFVENVVRVTFDVTEKHVKDVAVVFKVKCSSPGKFHVHPRVGSMLVRSGSTTCSIALHVSAKEEGSTNASSIRSPLSMARSAATPSTVKGTRDYQERFSIEAFFVTDDEDVAAAASDATANGVDIVPSSKLAQKVSQSQKLYDKAAHGGPRPTMVPLKAVTIRVYLENVCMKAPRDGNINAVVVPPDAEVHFLPFRASPSSTRNANATPSRNSASPIPAVAPGDNNNLGAIAEETLRLKEELQRLQSAIAETERDKRVLERGVAGSTSILKKYDSVVVEESVDQEKRKKRGIPFVIVVAMMFLTFAISLYFRMQTGRAITNPFGLHRYPLPPSDEM
jgi:hypothetical protein